MMTIFRRTQNEKVDIKGTEYMLVSFLTAMGRFRSLVSTKFGEILGKDGSFTT